MAKPNFRVVFLMAPFFLPASPALAQRMFVHRGIGGGGVVRLASPQEGFQSVSLPYAIRDQRGVDWQFRQDGSCGDSNTFPNDGYAGLYYESTRLGDCSNAQYDPEHGDLTIGPASLQEFKVMRHIHLDVKRGFCRYVDVIENPTNQDQKIRPGLYNKMAGSVRYAKLADPSQPQSIVVGDGRVWSGIVSGSRNSGLGVELEFKPGAQGGTVHYAEFNIGAHQSMTLIHILIHRSNPQELSEFIRKTPDAEYVADLPADLVKGSLNFGVHTSMVGAFPIVRGNALDVLKTRNDDEFSGTASLEDPAAAPAGPGDKSPAPCRIETDYGHLVIAQREIVCVLGLGETYLRQLVMTRSGEAFSGRLAAQQVAMELPDGNVMHVPLSQVKSLGYRLAADEMIPVPSPATTVAASQPTSEPAQVPVPQPAFVPYVQLRSGDLLHIRPAAATLAIVTRYGALQLPGADLASIVFENPSGADRDTYTIRLTDGSSFGALLGIDDLELHLSGAAGELDAKLPAGTISRLQLTPPPSESRTPATAPAAAPTLKLANGDVFKGTLTGKMTLDTGFDTVAIDAPAIAALAHGEDDRQTVKLTLWDGTQLTGSLAEPALDCRLACGGQISIPVTFMREYTQPHAQIPSQMDSRIKMLVERLGSGDAQQGGQAAALLSAMGPGIVPVLKELRAAQNAAVQAKLDEVIAAMHKD